MIAGRARTPLVAVVGCGAVTRLYYRPALARLAAAGAVTVVGAFDPDERAKRTFCDAFPDAVGVESFSALLDRPVDLLIIASPPAFHADQAITALRAGVAILCEKPLASALADGERMVEAAAAAGRPLAVGMVRRRLPATRLIRHMLADGAIGTLRSVEVFEGGPFDWPVSSPAYFSRRAGGVGVLEDIGTHCLDLLRWWLGEPDSLFYEDDAMGGVEANCRIQLGFNGVSAHVRLSRDWRRPNQWLLRGNGGWLRWRVNEDDAVEYGASETGCGARLAPHTLAQEHGEPVLAMPAGDFIDAFAAQIAGALSAALDGGGEHVSGLEALETLRLVERCRAERTLMTMPWMPSLVAEAER